MNKLKFLLLLLPLAAFGQIQMGNVNASHPTGVQVVLTPPTISVGSNSSATARLQMADGSLNSIETQACSWSTSDPTIATVSVNGSVFVTGVLAGTATITCSLPGFTGSANITVGNPPSFTTPPQASCNAPPAVVTAGTQNVAYSFQPVQSGGTAPFTWTSIGGALPNGVSINGSTGLLSGTPSVVATFTPTIQVAAANGTRSCQISITIAAGSTCGPPTYPCTPSNVLGAFAPTVYPFSGLGIAHACPGVDCGSDNTIVMDPEPIASGNNSGLFHNPMIRGTNSHSACGNGLQQAACPATKLNVGFQVSSSDNNEEHWNTDDTMYWINDATGGGIYFYNFNPTASVWKSSLNCTANNAVSTMKIFGGGAFSRGDPHLWYALNNATDTGKGTFVTKWDMSTACPQQAVHIADMSFAGLLFPSNAIPCQPINVVNQSGWDGFLHFSDCFTLDSTHNDTSIYVAELHLDGAGHRYGRSWNTSNNTTTTCFDNNPCTTVPVVCQNCGTGHSDPGFFKIHNAKMSIDGKFIDLSPTGCTTTCYNGASGYFFEPDNGAVFVECNATLTPPVGQSGSCSGHNVQQYLHWINSPNGTQLAWKTYTSNTSAKFPAGGQPCNYGFQDLHPGNQNNTGTLDDGPIYVGTSIDSGAEDYTFCMAGEVMLFWPPYTTTVAGGTTKRMAHSYMGPNSVTSCFGAQQGLGSISQTGKFTLMTSNMNAQLGCQDGTTGPCAVSNSTPSCSFNTTQPRGDVFILVNQ